MITVPLRLPRYDVSVHELSFCKTDWKNKGQIGEYNLRNTTSREERIEPMTKDVHTATKRQITNMRYDTWHSWPKHTGDFLKSIMYENDSSQQTPIHIPMNKVRYIKPTCNTFYNCETDAYMLFGDNHSHLDMHNARTEWLWNSSLSCKINYPSSMNQLFCRIESIR